MSESIRGASDGGANLAGVNAGLQLLTRASWVTPLQEACERGDAYSWTSVNADIDIGDTALLVANTSDSRWLVIDRAYIWADIACRVYLHFPSPVTWAGAAEVVGKNLNRDSGKVAPAIAYADETASAIVAEEVFQVVKIPLATDGETTTAFGVHLDFDGAIILGARAAVAISLLTETTGFEVMFVGYFIDSPV